jgi:hypothetical protein
VLYRFKLNRRKTEIDVKTSVRLQSKLKHREQMPFMTDAAKILEKPPSITAIEGGT